MRKIKTIIAVLAASASVAACTAALMPIQASAYNMDYLWEKYGDMNPDNRNTSEWDEMVNEVNKNGYNKEFWDKYEGYEFLLTEMADTIINNNAWFPNDDPDSWIYAPNHVYINWQKKTVQVHYCKHYSKTVDMVKEIVKENNYDMNMVELIPEEYHNEISTLYAKLYDYVYEKNIKAGIQPFIEYPDKNGDQYIIINYLYSNPDVPDLINAFLEKQQWDPSLIKFNKAGSPESGINGSITNCLEIEALIRDFIMENNVLIRKSGGLTIAYNELYKMVYLPSGGCYRKTYYDTPKYVNIDLHPDNPSAEKVISDFMKEKNIDENMVVFGNKVSHKPGVVEVIQCDANTDGFTNVRDAAFIARRLAERAKDPTRDLGLPACADCNNDGKIDVRDAACLARVLATSVTKAAEE